MTRTYTDHENTRRGTMQPKRKTTYELCVEADKLLRNAETMIEYYYMLAKQYRAEVNELQKELDKETFGRIF